jgi:murein DD-endopeptidase MepM/ murein hydrolase activator NlpD
VSLSRARVVVGLGLLLCAAVAVAAPFWIDYLSLHRERSQAAEVRQLSVEQRQLLEMLGRRVAEIQSEIASWRRLHTRIWEPLGPETSRGPDRHGVGGGNPAGEAEVGVGAVSGQIDRLAAGVSEDGQKLRALEQLMARIGRSLGSLPSRWPVRGAVNSEFGRRVSPWTSLPEHHSGMDIAAEIGTPVRAPAPGTVSFAGSVADYGTTVVIDHGHDIKTLFGHLERIHVASGQKVDRGQQIALTGNTGKTSGPHLHYEITVRGQAVNPRAYLWE